MSHLSGYINPAVVTVFTRLIHTTYSPVLYSGTSNKLFNYDDYRTTTTVHNFCTTDLETLDSHNLLCCGPSRFAALQLGIHNFLDSRCPKK
ncbi:hypothetical protein Y032_0355g3347 [Ancylostoma ceylanicum]|uniref:Uncharacterized protein n=1 Tax=Ancylostoma ceylanicum TaxID=53326 RepID=A0A016RWE0_9BILA|nr:hypothetical protein Y032_0355g3347 [Ancylostoma ceylanicum]